MSGSNRLFIERLSLVYRFTFQELRQVSEIARDFEMWRETSFSEFWQRLEQELPSNLIGRERKKFLFKELLRQASEMKAAPKSYPSNPLRPSKSVSLRITKEDSDKNIFGNCPVASPKTVCCNLKTIDAVENCAFGCSYCTIQTFYGDRVVFDGKLKEKLQKIQLDSNRFYHIGTGQSSDSLVWGNREGILDDLCEFAHANPNILLEFKTKSDNISYFLDHDVPHNIVCSWSLNTDTIVENEEHFTASLSKRLEAARKTADRGIAVAFHFHPIVYYECWKEEYQNLAERVQAMFETDEVLFISFGSVTFIKPVIQEIRKRGGSTKILQMEMVPDPHGKLTYPDSIKLELFRTMCEAFKPWHGAVYMYLCMERAYFWDEVFGWHYPTNEEFESDFGTKVMHKVNS
ncbi:MAG: hypothetical protein HY583_02735 [Candidatus Omnitrophica bacterium]|nr:hypothetical protein [Candidatus Omnitrophota bacterium]